jgi:hypothetical protein
MLVAKSESAGVYNPPKMALLMAGRSMASEMASRSCGFW